MEAPKYAKPEGWVGKKAGDTTWRKLKWEITMFDKDSGQFKNGKFSTIPQLNQEMGLNLTNDIVYRLRTHKRVDESKRNKENSFLSKYGHIKIDKIDEWKEGVNHRMIRKNIQNVKTLEDDLKISGE